MTEKPQKQIKKILDENRYLREIVQSAIDYNRIYHHQKGE